MRTRKLIEEKEKWSKCQDDKKWALVNPFILIDCAFKGKICISISEDWESWWKLEKVDFIVILI